jgi:hypothetical protein
MNSHTHTHTHTAVQNSAPHGVLRDHRKTKGTDEALGDAPVPKASKNHIMVICGTIRPTEGWMFADFMADCQSFKERGIEGTFTSCFPLHEHFIRLANKNEGQNYKDIKFGKFGSQGDHHLLLLPCPILYTGVLLDPCRSGPNGPVC